MLYVIENFEELMPGVWRVKIPKQQLEHLHVRPDMHCANTIVLAPILKRGSELRMDPTEVIMTVLGKGDEVLLIDASHEGGRGLIPRRSDRQLSSVDIEAGDAAFFAACDQLVGHSLKALATSLVEGIREKHHGKMVEGQGRKWINSPDNFVAMTIQNRDRSLAISIKDVVEAKGSALNPKPDRPGYLRFKVSSAGDLQEAKRLILASARRHFGR